MRLFAIFIFISFNSILGHILGGSQVEIGEFAWLARLEYLNVTTNNSFGFACLGALINTRTVLTAGHCINYLRSKNLQLFRIRLGEYDLSSETGCTTNSNVTNSADPHREISISKYLVHPQYFNGYNDIALIFLNENVYYTVFIKPVNLVSPSFKITNGENGIIAGWGNIKCNKVRIDLPIWNTEKCYEKYIQYNVTLSKKRHFCAGGMHGIDTCTGDSGAPMVTLKSGVWTVFGITSIGRGCGIEGWPGIYTRVSFYLNWIHEEIDNNTI